MHVSGVSKKIRLTIETCTFAASDRTKIANRNVDAISKGDVYWRLGGNENQSDITSAITLNATATYRLPLAT
jgi:hypothetical protein